ncbi:hypothetical protein L596_001750 [Steinernema carpocapsae]|uniref:Uncharacterized protein n=1 Tax=Steinernema carpocapsae TaxID=34508 RepID=A0A4U8UR13_STECR|nr:hypothetical protein L596_001750 [Steinernema carpocapsae]
MVFLLHMCASNDYEHRPLDTQTKSWRPPTTRPQGRPATRWADDFTKKLETKNCQKSTRRETRVNWCNMGM